MQMNGVLLATQDGTGEITFYNFTKMVMGSTQESSMSLGARKAFCGRIEEKATKTNTAFP